VESTRKTGGKLWKGEIDVYFRLLEKPMTWTELKRGTGFSNTTLARYLKHLTDLGYIHHDPKTKTYRTSAYFLKLFPEKIAEAFRLVGELRRAGDLIERNHIDETSFKLNEAMVRAHASLLAASMPILLYDALGGKGSYEIRPQGRGRSRAEERLMERIWRDSHAVADEMLENWVRPWIHKLLDVLHIFSSSNKDVLTDIGGPMIEAAIREVERYDRVMKPFREAPMKA